MRILSLGEVMVELSGAGPQLWRSGFAGDTFNTAWYLAALCPGWQIAYGTRLGPDAMSDAAVEAIAAAGIGTDWITRDPRRSIGLYMITLRDGERSFSYWRDGSAARLMAEESDWLDRAFAWPEAVFLSGITLAILSEPARDRLLSALQRARASGRTIIFDPNIRPRLWESPDAMRRTIAAAVALADISLPSFDDEALAFGDDSPRTTARRHAELGAREVVVKNGPGPLCLWQDGAARDLPAPRAVKATDTTGAGDSFNAGYLAARLGGAPAEQAVVAGQGLAALVVTHPGALVPREVLAAHLAGPGV